jgi:pyruvate/2-oxoglutarate/acetoin dehydrogenase E1 component
VRKTGRLVIVDEEPRTGGWAAEVAALAAEETFDYLDAPVVRITAPHTPVPFAPLMERLYVPSAERIVERGTNSSARRIALMTDNRRQTSDIRALSSTI